MTTEFRTDNRSWGVQNMALAFVDALGTKEAMAGLDEIPLNPAARAQCEKQFSDVLHRLRATRDAFGSFFVAAHSTAPLPVGGILPRRILQRNFSDAVTLAVEFSGDDSYLSQTDAILRLLYGVSMMQLIGLSVSIPQRGGIDLAVGTEIEPGEGEVYGPVLVRAHDLEHNHAEYPRVIIGTGLLQFLMTAANREVKDDKQRGARVLAESALRMMWKDTDGRRMLDFMGTEVRSVSDGALPKQVVLDATNFVAAQGERFAKEGNEKLWSRYFRLVSYMKSRLELWQLDTM